MDEIHLSPHRNRSIAMVDPQKRIPRSETQSRIVRLQKQLANQQIGGALIIQKSDLYYFSGTRQEAYLYVPQQGDPLLMVRGNLLWAKSESSIENVAPLKSATEWLNLIRAHGHDIPRFMGMELDVLPANLFLHFQKRFDQIQIRDISNDIRILRSVKSAYEIELIEKATRLSEKVAARVPEFLREGMTEMELAGLVEAEARKLGHPGIVRMRIWGGEVFFGHLLAGPPAAIPSYLESPTGGLGPNPAVAQGAGMTKIGRQQPIMLDYAFVFNGYISDNARIFALGGLPEDLIKTHQAMLSIQETVKKAARPGVSSGALYDLAWEQAHALHCQDVFMGCDDQRVRFVGHGVGLEIDEYPFIAKGQSLPLQEGMVIALEPKAIIPDKGVVGIENTHVVTQDGLRQLTTLEEQICIV